jgi:radical SAM superfamily enzyme YgiQ (UPF0313 family)
MSKILIIFPRLEPFKQWHYMPYSALCVASYWINHGAKVRIHDERLYPLKTTDITWADTIMFTAYTGFQVTDAYRLTKQIKATLPDKKIIWGGPHADLLPQQCLDDENIDMVIQGYMETGQYDIPWHLVDIEKYINPDTKRFIYISSYGCPGQCTFCATKPKRKLVFISLDKVERDIDNLMKLHTFRECIMYDATLFTRPERALFISRLMKKHNLQFICDSRADEIYKTDKTILDEIMASGLKQITIGLESGSPAVVEHMKKGKNHLENYRKCAEILSHFHIKMCSGVIFGTPGEGPEDIWQTIEYIKEIKAINPNFYISSTFFKPLPCTEMAEMCKEYGYIEPDSLQGWAEYGEQGHYKYNQFDDVPWIKDIERYKAIYNKFTAENGGLFI